MSRIPVVVDAARREQRGLVLRPISQRDALAFVREHHRHNKPPNGWKWGTSVWRGDRCVGVIIVGRPIGREIDQVAVLEVTRCCTLPVTDDDQDAKHAASMLYGAARRAARALGYTLMLTYTLETEPGTTLKAAGWTPVTLTEGGGWSCVSRPRADDHAPLCRKVRWEVKP